MQSILFSRVGQRYGAAARQHRQRLLKRSIVIPRRSVPFRFDIMVIRNIFLLAGLVLALNAASTVATTVSVTFYGESQCPMCRQWVTESWQEVWTDSDLMQYVEYDFIAWGNAYFSTAKCGSGPYSAQERACWYDECIVTSSDNEETCFGGDVVYQHSKKEGEVDIYEMCVKNLFGISNAVDFTYCCEGSKMDNSAQSSEDLMKECLPTTMDPAVVQTCFETEGDQIEISSAKSTPKHPGVPYVEVDGVALDDPFSVKAAICSHLGDIMHENDPIVSLPTSCTALIEDGTVRIALS